MNQFYNESILYRTIKYLLAEVYKVKMGLFSLIMSDKLSLSENSSNNPRSGATVHRRNIRTSKCSFEIVSTIRANLWNDLRVELKNVENLKIFKQKKKLWSPNDCSGEI